MVFLWSRCFACVRCAQHPQCPLMLATARPAFRLGALLTHTIARDRLALSRLRRALIADLVQVRDCSALTRYRVGAKATRLSLWVTAR